jgi:NADH-quinone oxidoreductase subunit N
VAPVPAARDAGGAVAAGTAGTAAGAGDHALGTARRQPELVFVAVASALATIAFGVYPSPLFDVARDAGQALTNLL